MGYYRTNKLIIAFFLFFLLTKSSVAEIIERIVAVVGENPITITTLARALGAKKSQDLLKISRAEQEKVLDALIEKQLVEQKAQKLGISVADKEVDEEIEGIKKANNITTEILEQALQREGLSFSDYRDTIRYQILKAKVINKEIRPFIVVNEEILKQYYQNEIASGFEKMVSFSVVTIYDDEKGKLNRDIKEYYSMAQKKVSFHEIAKKASEKYKVNNTTSGYIKISALAPELREAMKNMKPSQLGPLIKFSEGYQIFILESIKYDGLKPFEEIKEELRKQYQKEKLEQLYNKWLEDVKKEIYVEKRL